MEEGAEGRQEGQAGPSGLTMLRLSEQGRDGAHGVLDYGLKRGRILPMTTLTSLS